MTTPDSTFDLEREELLRLDDDSDRALLEATHPSDWLNPDPAPSYNLVVIGGGTAGLVAAAGAAGLGARVALVERRLLGGDCLNFGCVPSKALLHVARVAATTKRSPEVGVHHGSPISIDGRAAMKRVRNLRATIAPHDSAQRLRKLGVDVFFGNACFASRSSVRVGSALLRFKKACIATGARPAVPAIPGLAESGYLTNESVFTMEDLPGRLAVLGGGPIGCELAQAFARLGVTTTLIETGRRVLPREHADASGLVANALRADGVDMRMETTLVAVKRTGRASTLHLESPAGVTTLDVDRVLVAVGRVPNVDGLALDAAGVAADSKLGILVDDRLCTSNKHIFASGDVASRFKFTHAADAASRIVLRNALFYGRARASALTMPWCTYTDPEVAHTGQSTDDLTRSRTEFRRVRVELTDVDRAILDDSISGFLELRVDARSDRVLGATLVASHAGDMISELTTLIAARRGLRFLSSVIHPYPTNAEVMKRAADAFVRDSVTPRIKRVLRAFMAWRR